jgi:hypothetical protein
LRRAASAPADATDLQLLARPANPVVLIARCAQVRQSNLHQASCIDNPCRVCDCETHYDSITYPEQEADSGSGNGNSDNSQQACTATASWVVRGNNCEEARATNMASLAHPLSCSRAGACLALAHFTPASLAAGSAMRARPGPGAVHLVAIQVRLGFPGPRCALMETGPPRPARARPCQPRRTLAHQGHTSHLGTSRCT